MNYEESDYNGYYLRDVMDRLRNACIELCAAASVESGHDGPERVTITGLISEISELIQDANTSINDVIAVRKMIEEARALIGGPAGAPPRPR